MLGGKFSHFKIPKLCDAYLKYRESQNDRKTVRTKCIDHFNPPKHKTNDFQRIRPLKKGVSISRSLAKMMKLGRLLDWELIETRFPTSCF